MNDAAAFLQAMYSNISSSQSWSNLMCFDNFHCWISALRREATIIVTHNFLPEKKNTIFGRRIKLRENRLHSGQKTLAREREKNCPSADRKNYAKRHHTTAHTTHKGNRYLYVNFSFYFPNAIGGGNITSQRSTAHMWHFFWLFGEKACLAGNIIVAHCSSSTSRR